MDKDKVQLGEFAKSRDVLGLFKAFEKIINDRNDEVANIIKAVIEAINKTKETVNDKEALLKQVISDVEDNVNQNLKKKVKPILERINYLERTYKSKIDNAVFETRDDLISETGMIYRKIASLKEYISRLELKKGDKGDDGKRGSIPRHGWDGTKIRFENSDGTWGDWVDLKGQGGFSFFGGSSGIETVKSNGLIVKNGASEINFGTGLSVSPTSNGVRVDSTGGSSSIPQDVTLSYTGDNVTNVTLEDGTEFDLTYTGDNLTTVTDGTYTWTLNYTGDNLTSVTV